MFYDTLLIIFAVSITHLVKTANFIHVVRENMNFVDQCQFTIHKMNNLSDPQNSSEMLKNHFTLYIFKIVLSQPHHILATSTCISAQDQNPNIRTPYSPSIFLGQLNQSASIMHFTETVNLLLCSQSQVITVLSKINPVHTLPLLKH